VLQTCALVRVLRQLRPGLKIVLGGPEVSHETDGQEVVALADHVITGWGDTSFPALCRALLFGPQPLMKVFAGVQAPLAQISLPYGEYAADDLAHRTLYVEASRGCPFKCEFCLSSLDKTAWAFDSDRFLHEMGTLYTRGARRFKFVDRTFNLKIDSSVRILQFFLDRLAEQSRSGPPGTGLFVHFEVIPDHLPERLRAMIAQFPPGVLQFEVGIQSFNEEVQKRIARKQDNALTVANLRWLQQHSHAHLHTDLIFGLPGESLQSFADGFDRLYALRPHEIQLGLLKRLRGTPIARHAQAHGMRFDDQPPYALLCSDVLDADTVQHFGRVARYWDLLGNSGRFQRSVALLLGQKDTAAATDTAHAMRPSAFMALWAIADWLWSRSQSTHGLTPEVLVQHMHDYLVDERGMHGALVTQALLEDYRDSGARARPPVLQALLTQRTAAGRGARVSLAQRQFMHRQRADLSV